MRLVVTSTAGRAVGYAARCVQSVARQLTGYDRNGEGHKLAHWFSSSDNATHLDAENASWERFRGTLAAGSDSPLERLVPMWLSLAPDDVVVWLDGDDELAHDGVIERVAAFHELQDVWMTYGSFVRDDGILDYVWLPVYGRRYELPPRSSPFRATHLRTFRAGLFHALHEQSPGHLRDQRGEYFKAAPDVAVMVALLELAGERYSVATDVLCRYNYRHSARSPGDIGTQRRDVDQISRLPALDPLAAQPWFPA